MASQSGKVEVVEALLAAGADREAKDNVRAPPCPPRPPPAFLSMGRENGITWSQGGGGGRGRDSSSGVGGSKRDRFWR